MASPPEHGARKAAQPRAIRAPILCYRIADPRFPVMDGAGAALIGGRWNDIGRTVVYTAVSFGGALIEQLAHANIGRLPPRVFVSITIPVGVRVSEPDGTALRGWDQDDYVTSRHIGREWLNAARTVALIVPSKTGAPIERNVILNPAHTDFSRLVVSAPQRLAWDARLHTRAGRRTP